MKTVLAVPDVLYVQPLAFGLDRPESPFTVLVDFPSRNSLKLSERSDNVRSAFLSPIDYARHGGEYCIVPGVCAASSRRTDTIRLLVKSEAYNIKTIASDIRLTSELVLAKIILKEKFPNLPAAGDITFVPMLPDPDAMLAKADAALLLQAYPADAKRRTEFALDLVEEWFDLTDLPYVHGFWVARDEDVTDRHVEALINAGLAGIAMREKIAEAIAARQDLPIESMKNYLNVFSFELDEVAQQSVSEFFRLAYYHGVIGDVPDLNFFDFPSSETSSVMN